jgi:hypothetical protein
MSDYLTDVQLLGSELVRVEQAFRGLANSDWRRPTLLQPPGDKLPPWTIFELAGHLDIAVGVTRMSLARPSAYGTKGPDIRTRDGSAPMISSCLQNRSPTGRKIHTGNDYTDYSHVDPAPTSGFLTLSA